MFTSKCAWQAGVASGALLAGAVIGMPQCFGSTVVPPPETYAFQFTNSTGSSQDSLSLVLNGDQIGTTPNLSGNYENCFGTSSSSSYSSGTGTTTLPFSGTSVAGGSTAIVGFGWTGSLAPDITNAY